VRHLTIAIQDYHMRTLFPQFTSTTDRHNWIRWTGTLRPTSLSETYTVRIDYELPRRPSVEVLKPELESRPDQPKIPHTFAGNKLCLHTPGEWNSQMIIARTIVPWISIWLYFYEVWQTTGEWAGGGVHPGEYYGEK
jgi:hypothetical protein